MNQPTTPVSSAVWQKTQYANLIRYIPSGTYFARVKVQGKLIRRSLETDRITVAKLRLADLEKQERQVAEVRDALQQGRMTAGEAIAHYRQRVEQNARLKPRTRAYYQECAKALTKSWPELVRMDVRRVSRAHCEEWAVRFAGKSSASVYNHTIALLRQVLEIAVEMGARYDNPARSLKRLGERPKELELPEPVQFERFVEEIRRAGGRFSADAANLVSFLAFGGFRKLEASFVTWADVNFERGEIIVRGDSQTATKNGEIRRVPMIPEMRALLKTLRQERLDESPVSPVMPIRECQKAMNRAAERVGMARVTHHDLRHLFATRCIESGVDIPTVSRWLGHKDGGALAMKVYGHLREQHSVAMAQRVTFKSQSPDES